MQATIKAFGLLSLASLFGQAVHAATFFPLINMTDTDGNLIQAHGGNIIQAQDGDGSWYWFGEDKTGETTGGTFIGVSCYKSSDFSAWEYQGHVLKPIADTNISDSRIVERPKVLYNDKNSEYVMWFHGDSSNYGDAQVGVATSKTIDGQYDWKGNFKPFGNDSRDMTIYKDPDTGTAYLIYATNNNADFSIASLDEDYYNVNETQYTFQGVYQEAPGVFKIDGQYYLLFSPQDGWTPTDNGYHVSSSMAGPWSDKTLLAPAGAYSYLTQNAYDITINGTEDTFYLYLGDHWSGNELGSSTYAFYPVLYNGSALSLHKTGGWTLDVEAGTWADLPYTTITAANSTTAEEYLDSCDDGCTGGKATNMTGSSNFTFTWDGSAGDKVVQIVYTYPGAKNAFKQIGATVDGKAVNGTALLETTRATTMSQQAPIPLTLAEGSEVVLKLLNFDGTQFLVDGVQVYDA
ncbi:glycoside hydrolase family 43 protein [Zasmidium cellare ATCC 36951]|uniref:Glycoside hydrolase family 43 protein n=1 Tax=Zasmidium cellare ATCC 36951 TaxID=1080233 RepID=A0A6A6CEA4_ZASCE|nr:glycoside hydrolase family 43 protein [Zasmidium cellare ATCC 36951]KAF2163756.1 glycoside hydrolase family 43 protein [Zasmidium cellare ATCC 36951]